MYPVHLGKLGTLLGPVTVDEVLAKGFNLSCHNRDQK